MGGGADFTVTETMTVTRIVPQDLKIRLLRLRTVFTAVISVSASLFFSFFFFKRHVCKGDRVQSLPKKRGHRHTHTHTDVSLYDERPCMSEHASRTALLFLLQDGESDMLWKRRRGEARLGENTNNSDNCSTAATYTKSE